MSTYQCPHCLKKVDLDSLKQWIRSYCEQTQRMTRIYRIKE